MAVIVVTAWVRDIDVVARHRDLASWLVMRFAYWDSTLYGAVADRGYPAPGETCCYQAFFPGFPLAMRWGSQLFGGDYFWAGWVIVQASGAVAALLLWQLVWQETGSRRAAWFAVVALAVFPTTVFMSVVYTEAPFLALSLGAWIAARNQRWWVASACGLLASTLRLNAAFLTCALLMMLLSFGRARPRSVLPALAAGPAFIAGYFGWLWSRSGHWDAWSRAQDEGWGRAASWPWVGMSNWVSQMGGANSGHLLVSRVVELAATIAFVVITVVLLRRRRWAESVLVGLNTVSLVCTTTFMGNARFLLVCFPLYVLLGLRMKATPRWGVVAFFAASSMLALFNAWAWAMHYWVA
ncbi:MAG: hypothetical protein LWW86_14610 [Micrococcales bacterium]|nr:hypothetical protein [Micrococcales bacterium]